MFYKLIIESTELDQIKDVIQILTDSNASKTIRETMEITSHEPAPGYKLGGPGEPIKQKPAKPTRTSKKPTNKGNKPLDSIVCSNCGTSFTPKIKSSKPRRFCSKKCYMEDYWKTYVPKSKTPQEPKSKSTPPKGVGDEKKNLNEVEPPAPPAEKETIILTINGKRTEISGTPEQLERFQDRITFQKQQRTRKYKPAKKVLQEENTQNQDEE